MAKTKFHFVDDYRGLVRQLMNELPIDEAMSRAVGGSYEAFGEIEKQALIRYGLQPDHTLVDIGCGSGRLQQALRTYMRSGRVLSTDVVPELLEYAREGCPPSWQFTKVDDIRIPFPDNCADFASFFSVFTHLLHEETFCYLIEARRVVKPGGVILFSFLEYEDNWTIFENTVRNVVEGRGNEHLNTFISREAIQAWAQHIDLAIIDVRAAHDPFIELSQAIEFDDGRTAAERSAMGQSLCALRNAKPATEGDGKRSWSTGGYRVNYRLE
jgi:ubiquinone/menaquinone biosynthesis C-methylase UbiE